MTTRNKLEFVHAMARRTRATVRQCEALMRYGATHFRLSIKKRDEGLEPEEWAKLERIRSKVTELCGEILMAEGSIWKLTAPDSQRIRCQCGQMALYGRSPNGGAPFWYECQTCFPYGPLFAGAGLKIRVPDGGEICVPG